MENLTVLHINKFHYMRGGSERVYFRTAEILESYGKKSIFFSMNHNMNIGSEFAEYFMPYVDLNRTEGGFAGQIKTALRILYSFEAKKRLAALLDKYPTINIAHLHNIHHQISPSILHLLKKRNIAVVMTLHDYKMGCASYTMIAGNKICESCSNGRYTSIVKKRCVKNSFIKSFLATIEMYLHHKILNIYNNVDIFISPSIFLKNKLEEMGFDKKIVHLPNFIDAKTLNLKNSDKNNNTNTFLYFGRLSSEKGLFTLLRAAKILRNNNSKITLKIIGDGELKSYLEKIVKDDDINNVIFCEHMNNDQLDHEINNSLAVILPSEWYENSPMSILESFALAKPVIGAKIGGIPELIIDGVTGYTFEAGNAEDLVDKVMKITNDNEGRYLMGKNAKETIERDFSSENYYHQLLTIYDMAIQTK